MVPMIIMLGEANETDSMEGECQETEVEESGEIEGEMECQGSRVRGGRARQGDVRSDRGEGAVTGEDVAEKTQTDKEGGGEMGREVVREIRWREGKGKM